jgi:hypothetical protein
MLHNMDYGRYRKRLVTEGFSSPLKVKRSRIWEVLLQELG